MAGEYGIGLGIQQGLQKVDEGLQRRLQLQQVAENQEQQRRMGNISISNAELNQKMLLEKVDKMEKDKARQSAFYAFDSFETSGDTKYLNLAIKDNPILQDAMKQTGITGIGNIKDLSPEKLKSLGYREEEFVRPVVYHKADGTMQIGDMFSEYGKFGYLERAKDNVIQDYEMKVQGLKLQQAELDTSVKSVEADNYLSYVEGMISKGQVPLSMKEFGKPAKGAGGGSSDLKTKTQAVALLAELATKPDEELTELERNQKNYFTKYVETDSDVKRQIISAGLKTSDKFIDGVSNKEVTLDDIKAVNTAAALVGDNGDKATTKALTDNYVTLKQGYKLAENVNALGNDEIERGLVDQGFLEVKKIFSDTDFDELSPEEKAKTLQTVKFNTRLGSYLADYIRSISGTAASEAEFIRLKTVLTGGVFNNTQTLKSAINEFVSVEDEKFKSNLDAKYMLSKTEALKLKYSYDKELNGKLVKPKQTEAKPQISKEDALKELQRRGLIK